MRITAADLQQLGVIERIIPELRRRRPSPPGEAISAGNPIRGATHSSCCLARRCARRVGMFLATPEALKRATSHRSRSSSFDTAFRLRSMPTRMGIDLPASSCRLVAEIARHPDAPSPPACRRTGSVPSQQRVDHAPASRTRFILIGPFSPATAAGTIAFSKPSLAASLRRSGACATGRSPPDSATSPKAIVSGGTGRSDNADTRAAATARSAAGSITR